MCSNRLAIVYIRKCKSLYHKFGLKHVVLLFFYIWYLVLGAVMFHVLEYDNVNYLHLLWQITLDAERSVFIRSDLMPLVFNNTVFLQFINDERTKGIAAVIEKQLIMYERRLGVEFRSVGPLQEWEFRHAVLYSISLCTTIGYGLIHPMTTAGRVASIIYSLFGIPFTMVLVRDWSRLVAKLLNYPGSLLLKCWDVFRYCTLKAVSTIDELKATRERDRFLLDNVLLNIPTSVAFLAMLGWIVIGTFAFCSWESGWTVLDSFLFCYNSITTTGHIGNTVPQETRLLLIMMLYIYAGLAIVSLFIDLIYAKFLLAYKPAPFVMHSGGITTSTSGDESPPLTRSSNDNESVDRGVDRDVDLGSCVTLGILRMDGRAHKDDYKLRNDRRYQLEGVSRSAQTRISVPEKRLIQIAAVTEDGSAYQHVILPADDDDEPHQQSSDDVRALLMETYSARRPS